MWSSSLFQKNNVFDRRDGFENEQKGLSENILRGLTASRPEKNVVRNTVSVTNGKANENLKASKLWTYSQRHDFIGNEEEEQMEVWHDVQEWCGGALGQVCG